MLPNSIVQATAPIVELDRPMLVYPRLAQALGSSDAAIFLSQLHYWLPRAKNTRLKDKCKWVFKPVREWLNEITWLCRSTVQRIIYKLEELGILLSEQVRRRQHDQTKWYRIDYEALFELTGFRFPDSHQPSENKPVTPVQKGTMEYVKLTHSIVPKWKTLHRDYIQSPPIGDSLSLESLSLTERPGGESQEREDRELSLNCGQVPPRPQGGADLRQIAHAHKKRR